MSKLLNVLMLMWASPLTLLGLLHVVPCWMFGWYKLIGRREDGIVWILNVGCMPWWLTHMWSIGNGYSCGNIVVLRHFPDIDPGKIVLRHELEHVRQTMVMGPMYPIAFIGGFLTLCACGHAHPLYDHPLEVDARRAAGQVVDVIGALRKLAIQGKLNVRHGNEPHA